MTDPDISPYLCRPLRSLAQVKKKDLAADPFRDVLASRGLDGRNDLDNERDEKRGYVMLIDSNMDLSQLQERMGDCATGLDAREMRALLVDRYDGYDTSEIPEYEWSRLLGLAVQNARGPWRVELDTGETFTVPADDTGSRYEDTPTYGIGAVLERARRAPEYLRANQAQEVRITAVITPDGDRVTQF